MMSNMRNNISALFEVIWFVLGGLMLFMAVDLLLDSGLGESWYYFLFSFGIWDIFYYIFLKIFWQNIKGTDGLHNFLTAH